MTRKAIIATTAVACCALLPTRLALTAAPLPPAPAPEPIATSITPDLPLVESVLAHAIERCASEMSDDQQSTLFDAILRESRRYGYDPLFVQAMLEVESDCDPTALGPQGSMGLIQLRPETAREVAINAGLRWRGARSLRESGTNVRLALHYLASLESRFDDPYLALAAYNLGPAKAAGLSPARARRNVYVRKVLARYNRLLVYRTRQLS